MLILSFVYMEQERTSILFSTRRTIEFSVSTLTHASFRIDVAQVDAVTKVEVTVGRKLGVEGHVEQSLSTRPSGVSRREHILRGGGHGGGQLLSVTWLGFPRPSRGVTGGTNTVFINIVQKALPPRKKK